MVSISGAALLSFLQINIIFGRFGFVFRRCAAELPASCRCLAPVIVGLRGSGLATRLCAGPNTAIVRLRA